MKIRVEFRWRWHAWKASGATGENVRTLRPAERAVHAEVHVLLVLILGAVGRDARVLEQRVLRPLAEPDARQHGRELVEQEEEGDEQHVDGAERARVAQEHGPAHAALLRLLLLDELLARRRLARLLGRLDDADALRDALFARHGAIRRALFPRDSGT